MRPRFSNIKIKYYKKSCTKIVKYPKYSTSSISKETKYKSKFVRINFNVYYDFQKIGHEEKKKKKKTKDILNSKKVSCNNVKTNIIK